MRGEYAHSVDSKGRLFVPAKFREELGEKFVITKGLSKCLSVYPMEEWERFEQKINSLPTKQARQLQLFFIAASHDCEIDAQGRVLIPLKLREYAELGKNVIVAGMTSYIEIWDENEWNNLNLTPEAVSDIMEAANI